MLPPYTWICIKIIKPLLSWLMLAKIFRKLWVFRLEPDWLRYHWVGEELLEGAEGIVIGRQEDLGFVVVLLAHMGEIIINLIFNFLFDLSNGWGSKGIDYPRRTPPWWELSPWSWSWWSRPWWWCPWSQIQQGRKEVQESHDQDGT